MGRGVLMFERKHMIAILLFVKKNGGCTRMELYDNVANNDGMPGKLAELESSGLITQHTVPITRAVRIELTPSGEKAVSLFSEIDGIIS